MNDRLGIGVIGLGMGANMLHVNRHRLRFRAEVRAVCDLREDRLRSYAADFGVPFATGAWRELVLRPDVDVVAFFRRTTSTWR